MSKARHKPFLVSVTKTSHFLVPRCFPLISTSSFFYFCKLWEDYRQRKRERETDTVERNRETLHTVINSCKVLYFSWVISGWVSSHDFARTFCGLILTNHALIASSIFYSHFKLISIVLHLGLTKHEKFPNIIQTCTVYVNTEWMSFKQNILYVFIEWMCGWGKGQTH